MPKRKAGAMPLCAKRQASFSFGLGLNRHVGKGVAERCQIAFLKLASILLNETLLGAVFANVIGELCEVWPSR